MRIHLCIACALSMTGSWAVMAEMNGYEASFGPAKPRIFTISSLLECKLFEGRNFWAKNSGSYIVNICSFID